MDLNQIGTFIRVVETGTFTAAALALGLPKSSVSRGVAQLEEALGVRLLQRTTRKLNLTEAGRRYYQRARRSLSELDQANSAAADTGGQPRGVVRLTAPGDFPGGALSGAIADFLLRYPRIQIDLWITQRWVNLVELEERLSLKSPGIVEAAAVCVPDSDGVDAVAFFFVADDDAAAGAALRACADTLPHYQRPRWLHAVATLPRTPTGKLLRRKLQELHRTLD